MSLTLNEIAGQLHTLIETHGATAETNVSEMPRHMGGCLKLNFQTDESQKILELQEQIEEFKEIANDIERDYINPEDHAAELKLKDDKNAELHATMAEGFEALENANKKLEATQDDLTKALKEISTLKTNAN